jgi:hypothetical protein
VRRAPTVEVALLPSSAALRRIAGPVQASASESGQHPEEEGRLLRRRRLRRCREPPGGAEEGPTAVGKTVEAVEAAAVAADVGSQPQASALAPSRRCGALDRAKAAPGDQLANLDSDRALLLTATR